MIAYHPDEVRGPKGAGQSVQSVQLDALLFSITSLSILLPHNKRLDGLDGPRKFNSRNDYQSGRSLDEGRTVLGRTRHEAVRIRSAVGERVPTRAVRPLKKAAPFGPRCSPHAARGAVTAERTPCPPAFRVFPRVLSRTRPALYNPPYKPCVMALWECRAAMSDGLAGSPPPHTWQGPICAAGTPGIPPRPSKPAKGKKMTRVFREELCDRIEHRSKIAALVSPNVSSEPAQHKPRDPRIRPDQGRARHRLGAGSPSGRGPHN
jgi:hypothetical protein